MAGTNASVETQATPDSIRDVVDALGTVQNSKEAKPALLKLAALCGRKGDPVNSFELLQNSLVEGLPRFANESRSFGREFQCSVSVNPILIETFFLF
jgi:hypothetical protein